jgi:hypothetical protein
MPKDGKPITQWPDRDEAFLDVARSIRRAIEEIGKADAPKQSHTFIEEKAAEETSAALPRSSNLRLRKEFTQADQDQFLLDAFEYMNRFFQGSLHELQARNPGTETRHRRIDGNCFTAVIYQNGHKVAGCTIRFGGMLGDGITYSDGENARPNSCNESLSVETDDQKLFLRPMGMPQMRLAEQHKALSHEGAAEYYWALLMRPLQGN